MATLITGATGILGTALVFRLQAQEPLCLVSRRRALRIPGATSWTGDLALAGAARNIVREFRPKCVLHAAAFTDVDWCQSHPDEAARLHVEATAELAQAAAEIGAAFVYISTDSVFNGQRGGYDETCPPDPLNLYAKTKLAGEKAAERVHPRPLIVRTCLYGWNALSGKGLAEWVVGRLLTSEAIGGFVDAIFTPILANDLAEILLEMVAKDLSGLYHVGGREPISKFEFARSAAREFGLESALVTPARLADQHFAAPRPQNTSLVSTKAARALGREMPDVESGLARLRELRDSGWADSVRAVAAPVSASRASTPY